MEKPNRLGHIDFPVDDSLKILESNATTEFKREAMSSLGRKRDPSLKPIFCKYLENHNPEVVLQAIRGLLKFKDDPSIESILQSLSNHPNEMIREVIHIETQKNNVAVEIDHTLSPDFMKNTAVHGDVLEILKSVPEQSIHLTFTSPPYYNAREYSKYRSYDEYLFFLEAVFSELHRVTKEGRFFVLNTSPVITPRAGRKYSSRRYAVPFDIHPLLTKIGWEFIDDIVWAKPEKSAKNRVAGFEMNRTPLTYKANARTEYVMVYRKKSFRLLDWNLRQYSKQVIEDSKVDDNFERSNVWDISPARDRIHNAVFPIKLCDQIVKLYSFQNDLVFDPFAGSGTLGKAATALKRYYFLTEANGDYIKRITERFGSDLLNTDFQHRVIDTHDFTQEVLTK